MRYYVTIQDREIEVDLRGDTPLVDGEAVPARLAGIGGTDVYHLLTGAESHALVARAGARRGEWRITLDGWPIELEVLDERARAIRALGGGAAAEAARVVAAPMPGLVVRVNVEVGQSVTAGQGVVVIEAMKMENELKSPVDGVVARIEVSAGSPVEKGAVLIVLD